MSEAGKRRGRAAELDDRARRHGYKDAADWLRMLRADGLTNRECARIMGVASHTIDRIVREAGLPKRRRGPHPKGGGAAPSLLRMDRRGVVEGSHRDVGSAVAWLHAHGYPEASVDVLRDAGMPDNADEIIYGHRWWRYEPAPSDVRLATLRHHANKRNAGTEWGSSGEFRAWLDLYGLGDTGLRRIDRSRPWGPDNTTVNPRSPDNTTRLLRRRWNAMRRHGGVDPAWDDFDVFLDWGLDHEADSGTLWTRCDTTQPWGPGNTIVSRPDRDDRPSDSRAIIRSGGGLPDHRFPSVSAAAEWLAAQGHAKAREGSLWPAVTSPSGIHAYGFDWRSPDDGTISGKPGSRRPDNPVYARWAQMRHDSGVDSEWEDFHAFEQWCREHDIDLGANRLSRADTSQPWGPDNIRVARRVTRGSKKSPYYARWARMRHDGVDPEWADFRAFERWCAEHHVEPGDRLSRADTSRPWGPDNVRIVRKATAGASRSPHYKRWFSMRLQGGVRPEWDDFHAFERWCRNNHVEPGERLSRADTSRPWGPDNIKVTRRSANGAKKSPYYKRWFSMRLQGGVSTEWDDLNTFEQWCAEHHIEPGDRLHRRDATLPWGSDNIQVIRLETVGATKSPHYKQWIGIRRQGGVQPEWDDFRAFEQWCTEHHIKPGDRLSRIDTSRPWGSDNIGIVRREAIGVTKSPYYGRWRSLHNYGGVSTEWDDFRTFERWCEEHRIGPSDRLLRNDQSCPWGPDNIKGTQREKGPVKSSPYYTRWHGMRHNGGVESEWSDLHRFEQWCMRHHIAPGDQLRRADVSLPWGPGNIKGFQREMTGAGKPPNYWRWTNMRKKGGIQPEWERFRDFERWCLEHDVKPGDQLHRVDASRPWGPGNIAGIHRDTAGATRSPHYRRWLDMRQNDGVHPEWEQFRDFERWCLEHRIEPGDRLQRADTSQPWSPGNIRGVQREPTHAASSPYYNRWYRMRHKDGIRPEWERFEDFERWCREHGVEPADRLRRVDTSQPWGPGNIEVTRKDETSRGDSPYYARWRTMRRQGSVQPEWSDFKAFEQWCMEHDIRPGDRLQRFDTAQPWGPGNIAEL